MPVGGDIATENSLTASNVVEILLMCLIIVVNIVGNVSLWIVVLRSRTLRTVTNMFILGLSAAGNGFMYFTGFCLQLCIMRSGL